MQREVLKMKKLLLILMLSLLLVSACSKSSKTTEQKDQNIAIDNSETGKVKEQEKKYNTVFAITDKAADLGAVSSIYLTIDKVSVHAKEKSWIAVDDKPQTYDLLTLRTTGESMALATSELEPGVYDQVELSVSKVTIVDSKGSHDAFLPSGKIKIIGDVLVEGNKTTIASFDFIADESIHQTGKNEYIFAPVIKVETRNQADVKVFLKTVEIKGGRIGLSNTYGMDEKGNVRSSYKLGATANLTIANGKILLGTPIDASISGTGGITVYAKDSSGEVKSVTVTVLKVEAEKKDGTIEKLFSGRRELMLDDKTTTRIASKEVEAAFYKEIRILLDSEAIVEETDGTTRIGEVKNKQLTVGIATPLVKGKTLNVVSDIELKNTVIKDKDNYYFEPKPKLQSKLSFENGVETKSLGVINKEEESTLGISHSIGVIEITEGIRTSADIDSAVYV